MTQRPFRFVCRGIALMVALLGVVAGTAQAKLSIDINRGTANPVPIAITALQGQAGGDPQVGCRHNLPTWYA